VVRVKKSLKAVSVVGGFFEKNAIGKQEKRENQLSFFAKVYYYYNAELTYILVLCSSTIANYTLYVLDHN
jgi:hypothetical protein